MALAIFIIGSAISTGAQSMIMVIIGRGVAGIGAAGLLSVNLLAKLFYGPTDNAILFLSPFASFCPIQLLLMTLLGV
jgi:hypothetical protein